MLYKDLKIKSVAELQKLVIDLKAELFTLRFKNATGQLDQSHKIDAVKKDIAKCLTAIAEIENKQEETAQTSTKEPVKKSSKAKSEAKEETKTKKSTTSKTTTKKGAK